MRSHRWLSAVLIGLFAAGLMHAIARPALAQPKLREVTDDDVDRAIQRTIRYIYGRQLASGYWPDPSITGVFQYGTSALCLFALLDSGEKKNDAITKGIDALIKAKVDNTYVRALRAIVLAQAFKRSLQIPNPAMAVYRKAFQDDVDWLTKNAQNHGAWGYGNANGGPYKDGDNSCSQIALLALWEIERAGVEVGNAVGRKVEGAWKARQKKDGGWTYAAVGDGNSTPSMTAAGVASMFICQDVLGNVNCAPFANGKVIDDGMAWLAKNLKDDFVKNGYLAFCVERVGLTSGQKFIGTMDWFSTGARELVKPQPYGPNYRGEWGPDVGASFDLLFLSRGRVPLVFNKLDIGPDTGWDTHPRDIAQFAEHMRRTFEIRARWQIVKIKDDLRMLLDAPILLITSTKALALSDADWAKLREYSLRGGMLLFMPVHGNAPFADSVKDKLAKLYSAEQAKIGKHFTLDEIPVDDPIYIAHKALANGNKQVPLMGVSDGTRWVAVLSTTDLACAWQKPPMPSVADLFQAGVNMYQYATGRTDMGSRMRPVFVGSDQPATATVKVGWVKHGGNWNTQPFALDYLSQKLSAENGVALAVTAGVDAAKDNLAGFKLLWITGSEDYKFTDAEVAGLRKYLDDNGTIFINAVGSSEAFAKSADDLIDRLHGTRDGARALAPADHGLMTGKLGEYRGLPLDRDTLEQERALRWKVDVPRPPTPLELYTETGAARVIFARNGIHDTLDGHMSWTGLSYKPAIAGQIAANVVLYAMMERVKPEVPAATQPDVPTSQADDSPTSRPAGK